MKKNKLVSIVLVMMIMVIISLVAKDSFAASNNIIDITNTITGAGNNTTKNNVTNNTIKNITTNSTNNTTNKTNNTVLTTNNTSNYNNTTLPDTGIESSIAGVALVVVLGISAVYAYNKIQYYRDI